MSENPKPIRTQLGELHGRDAIYLHEFAQTGAALIFGGEINGALCQGEVNRSAWVQFRLRFPHVLAYDVRELDVCGWSSSSSFDEVEGSEWLQELDLSQRAREWNLGPVCHYVLWTYDWVYRVAADGFELEILGERPKPPRVDRGRAKG